MSSRERVDAAKGIIRGVCVMRVGEAKGHGVRLDKNSLETLLALTKDRPDGVGTRFGDDHEAKAKDFNGSLKDFRIEGDGLYADLHLLKKDVHYEKLLEMAETIPSEFGLSVVADAEKKEIGKDSDGNPKYQFKSPIRFEALDCVDIVSAPAATNGLFFSQTTTNQNIMTKEFALMLGLPETATEAEIKVAFAAKHEKMCKYEAEAEAKKKLEAEAEEKKKLEAEAEAKKKLEAEADDEEKGKQGKKKFEAELEALKLQVAELTGAAKAAQESAHKAEIENLKLEAAKEGKIISLTDEAILKLSVAEVKDMIAKLPKDQIKLSKGSVNLEAKPSFDLEAARQKKVQGAIALGQAMKGQLTLNK